MGSSGIFAHPPLEPLTVDWLMAVGLMANGRSCGGQQLEYASELVFGDCGNARGELGADSAGSTLVPGQGDAAEALGRAITLPLKPAP